MRFCLILVVLVGVWELSGSDDKGVEQESGSDGSEADGEVSDVVLASARSMPD